MINVLEIIMIISTFMYSYLILYCKRSSFVFGVFASGITAYILMSSGVYIQAVLHFIYMIIYVYSFFSWNKENYFKISSITNRGIILSITYILTFTVGMGYAFDSLDAAYPYIDAFSAACSMTAVFLLSRKIIQNSHIFIISNVTSIIICYMTKDYLTIITFVIYMIFNVIRIFTWSKIKENETLNT